MKVLVLGHRGMVGSAIVRKIDARKKAGLDIDVVTVPRSELDLLDQAAVRSFIHGLRPEAIVMAAAKVGGIHANATYPAEFIRENLVVQTNVVHEAWAAGVERLLFLGSSCIYPRHAAQPMSEEALLTGTLEPTNEPYAIAKIAGIKLCESYNRQYGTDYRSIMPTNLYGPGDNFHPQNSHVLPALIRRFHEAKVSSVPEVVIWGTGNARREFLHVDDMAEASLFVMGLPKARYSEATTPTQSHLNVGTGEDVSIFELAQLVADVVGFEGKISCDTTKPDGPPRKLLDVGRLHDLGWRASIKLRSGIEETYRWYVDNEDKARSA